MKTFPTPQSHAHSDTLTNTHTHTHCVPFPQSASAEVTRQVAANKALRGQLQEKEDKLCQLQDKLVSHLLSSLVLLPPFCVSYCCLQSSSYFSYFSFFFIFYTCRPLCLSVSQSLLVCMFAHPLQLSSVVFDSTMWQLCCLPHFPYTVHAPVSVNHL